MDLYEARALQHALSRDGAGHWESAQICIHRRFLLDALAVQMEAMQIPTIGMLRRELHRHDLYGCKRCPPDRWSVAALGAG